MSYNDKNVLSTDEHPVEVGMQSKLEHGRVRAASQLLLCSKLSCCVQLCSFYCLLSEWCSQYARRRVDVKRLQKEIDEFMADHDRRVEEVRILLDQAVTGTGYARE